MIRGVIAFAVGTLFAGAALAEDPAWVDRARHAAERLAIDLKDELTSALSDAGPAAAVSVCRDRAPAIAADLSGQTLRVGRTAPRVRNPDNAPDPWERDVLDTFVRRMRAGEPASTLERWEVHEIDGRRVGRWMKAIPMQPQCTLCHGPEIGNPPAETIARLYPEDEATGFEAGDLRGAFTVRVDLSAEGASTR